MSYLKIITLFIVILTVNIGCSEHCDDEDYTREQKEKKVMQVDSTHIIR